MDNKINFDIFTKGNEKKVFKYKGQEIIVYLDNEKEEEFIKFVESKVNLKESKVNIKDSESIRFLFENLTNLEVKGFKDEELMMILSDTNDPVLAKIIKEMNNLIWLTYEKIIDRLEEKIIDLELKTRQRKALEKLNKIAETDGITVNELLDREIEEENTQNDIIKPKAKTRRKNKEKEVKNENKDKE